MGKRHSSQSPVRGQGQCIETVQRKKAGDKQRGSGRGKWHSCRDTASGAGAVHRDCPDKKNAVNKQRGSGRGKWHSCRGTARRAGAVHKDCPEKKGRG
jgi:hypothetical protein